MTGEVIVLWFAGCAVFFNIFIRFYLESDVVSVVACLLL